MVVGHFSSQDKPWPYFSLTSTPLAVKVHGVLFVQIVQEKIDVLNERLEAANVASGSAKEDAGDSLDSMQAWKQSVKKCQ